MKRLVGLFVCSLCLSVILYAQDIDDKGTAFVKNQYPQLSRLFQKELISEHATYTFAIDVSGTMNKFSSIVQPALSSFIKALPDGDFVRIIRFGTSAKGSENGYLGNVNGLLKGDLNVAVTKLYSNSNDDKAFKAHTDVPAVVREISSALMNSEHKMNFVFILTDFRNDQTDGGERMIRQEELASIQQSFEAACVGKNGRIVALRLPVDVNAKGYCLPQLRESVFERDEVGLNFEMQDITSEAALSSWFEELKKQIMVERLRSIVATENKVTDVDLTTDIDIDGNVLADISWVPNKLYGSIQIDSSFICEKRGDEALSTKPANMTASGFTFKNNAKCFGETTDTQIRELELGQLKNRDIGFHKLDDELILGVSLPTPYDDELHKLGIKKPTPDVSIPVSRNIFTFFLSFTTCVILTALLLLYIILVIIKAGKNAQAYFKKTISVYSYPSQELVVKVTEKIKSKSGFIVPKMTRARLIYRKETSSPFLLHKSPRLVGTVENAFPCNSRGQRDTVKTNSTFYIQDKEKNIIYQVKIS